MTQGIFQKLFTLFEEACHQLDLKLAMHWKENSISSSEYEAYSSMLTNLSTAKSELECLVQEEEMIQQVATYYSIVDGSNELLAKGILELSSNCHTQVKVLVSEMHSSVFTFIIIHSLKKLRRIRSLHLKRLSRRASMLMMDPA